MPRRAELAPDPIAWAPIGLSIDEAARHIGVGATKFQQLVDQRLMPRPRLIGARKVWDRVAIELAFRNLPEEAGNRIDAALDGGRKQA